VTVDHFMLYGRFLYLIKLLSIGQIGTCHRYMELFATWTDAVSVLITFIDLPLPQVTIISTNY